MLKIFFMMFICVLKLIVVSGNVTASEKYLLNRRPQIMGDMLPLKAISPEKEKVQNKIVLYHNMFRSKVQPLAGNMLKMKWHKGAAKTAQKWAEKCKFLLHDDVSDRQVADYGRCGQNIFVTTKKVPWLFAIETWWLEKHKFVYGQKNNLSQIGHYSQLVWAASHQLGCGLAECKYQESDQEIQFFQQSSKTKIFYNYVCNYCPIGNRPGKLNIPYKIGPPCNYCKDSCSEKLCINSCHVANVWANCEFLYHAHAHWLCNTKSAQGKQRRNNCKATCECKHEIHD